MHYFLTLFENVAKLFSNLIFNDYLLAIKCDSLICSFYNSTLFGILGQPLNVNKSLYWSFTLLEPLNYNFSHLDFITNFEGHSRNLLVSGLFYQEVSNDLTYLHTQFLVMVVLASVLYFLSKLLSKKIFNLDKKSAYECGFEPFLILTTFIEVGFILVAFIFLIFDLELIFLSAFLVSSGSIGSFGIILVFIYLFSVWVMVFFEVFSGVLSWPVWNIFSISSSFWFYSLFLKSKSWFGMVSLFSKNCLNRANRSFEILVDSSDIGDFGIDDEESELTFEEALPLYREYVKCKTFPHSEIGGSFNDFGRFGFLSAMLSEDLGEEGDEVLPHHNSKVSPDIVKFFNSISKDNSQSSNLDFIRVLECGSNTEYQYNNNELICPILPDLEPRSGINVEFDSSFSTEDELLENFLNKCSRPGKNVMILFLNTVLDYVELSLSCYGCLFFDPNEEPMFDEYSYPGSEFVREPAPAPDLIFFKDSFGFIYQYQEACFRFMADDLIHSMVYEDAFRFNSDIFKVWILQLEFQDIGVDTIYKKDYVGMPTLTYYLNYLRTDWPLSSFWWDIKRQTKEEYDNYISPYVLLAFAISR